MRRKLSCSRDRPAARRLRPDDERPRQGGEPREGRAARRAGRGDRRRPRRPPGEVERDRDAGAAARGRGAARGRRVGRGDGRLGAAATGSRSSAARSPSGARGARSSRTRRSSSAPTASCSASTARSTSSTSRSAGHVYRESEAEEPGDEPVVVPRRGLAGRADRLLRRPLPRALPDPRARRRGARDRPGALHDADRQGPLARAPARAGDREPVLRRRAGAGRRDAAGEAGATGAR